MRLGNPEATTTDDAHRWPERAIALTRRLRQPRNLRIGADPEGAGDMRRFIAAALLGCLLAAAGVWNAPSALAGAPPARDISDGCPSSFPQGQFTDVSSSNVHRAAIDCIVGWGVTSGTSPGRYSPSVLVTRGQIASFLARLVERTGGQLPSNVPDAYDDDNGNLHEANINRLTAAGVMSGTGPRRFSPAQQVTRDQMATFVARTFQVRTGSPLPAAPEDYFTDDGASPHQDNINRVAAAGIVSGKTPDLFDPNGTVPRDAMASFLARLLDKLVEDGITRPPAQRVYLGGCNGGLNPVSANGGSCGQNSINGVTYVRSYSFSWCDFMSSCFSTDFAEFDLSRDFHTFTATLGLSDDSESAASALFEIVVDGQTKFSQTIGLGTAVPVSIDVSSALRLRLQVTPINVPNNSQDSGRGVFGEPVVES